MKKKNLTRLSTIAIFMVIVHYMNWEVKDFEGISYSPDNFFVKEKNPPSLLQLKYDDTSFSIEHIADFKNYYLEDYSDIF